MTTKRDRINQVKQLQWSLMEIEEALREILIDVVDIVEQRERDAGNEYWDDYVEQEDGEDRGILYWETVAPFLDSAIGMINEAADQLDTSVSIEEIQ